jgi:hypothetical protein
MIAQRLLAFGLTILGVALAGAGLYLLIAKAKLDANTPTGWASIAVGIIGLLTVAFAGSLWRSAGGGRIGVHRRTLRGRLGLPYGGMYARDDD